MKNLLSIIISTLIITGIFAINGQNSIINNRANTKFSRVIKNKEKIIDIGMGESFIEKYKKLYKIK
jgi:hypothetical protein